MELAKEMGAKRAMPLSVSGPFHCSMLKEAGEQLAMKIEEVQLYEPKIPIVINCTADFAHSKEDIAVGLVKQVSSPVLWDTTINKFIEEGVEVIVEVGAGKVLSGLIKRIAPEVQILNVEDLASLQATIETLDSMRNSSLKGGE